MSSAVPPAVRAYVALGANLGDPVAMLRAAFVALAELPDTRLIAHSALYRTAPVGVTGQPDYVNAVAALDTTLPAEALLEKLLAIEAGQGRTRDYHQAPRTLDLDVLLYGADVIDTDRLTVPHPRMHQRAFVLVPLAEIAPQALIPGHGTVCDCLPKVADQLIEKLPD